MKFFASLGAVLLHFVSYVSSIALEPNDEASLRSATADYAYGLMTYYKNNVTGLPATEIGIFPKPLYWWVAGAAWGGLIEYTQFSGDQSYVNTITQALVANYGPNNDILLPWRKDQEGNDDQAFWALALMSALEYQFPEPKPAAPATYLQVVENSFNNMISRWDTSSCNGGLKWQIYPENSYGYNYKNSISNGAVFALAARLAMYTGNKTYADWAVKIWDWSKAVGFIDDNYAVFDGADDRNNCTNPDHTEWSYNVGIYLHGAAALYNYTEGDEAWKKRTTGLLDHTALFFKPFDNATDIMYEVPCETGLNGRKCNLDQQSFKAYLSRFIAKTAILAPFTREKTTKYLHTSAVAAAASCTGPSNACGSKWYVGGFDGELGVGQQLSALEVTQALLMLKQNIVPGTNGDQDPILSSSTSSTASTDTTTIISFSPSISISTLFGTTSSSRLLPSVVPPSTMSSNDSVASSTSKDSTPLSFSKVPVPPTVSSILPSSVPGEFAPLNSSACSCTRSSTVTLYVPPTSAPAVVPPPAPSITLAPNGTVPTPPPASLTTGLPLFTGAAVSVNTAGHSILAAVVFAICGGIL
ncbi:hypothetical protein CC78DRAFT_530644 [Lojkania enalia]|uniref:mannan endo-1,6-alpha-mannosidase n=1 Tax=Lojkania enalia TaxID=147567 RepID=A0A9P4KIU7_9PLEO|nr:hypothetical protein CC78DRAFT_530644 [Didymosphaeria enalia]